MNSSTPTKPLICITGATGFLGREIVQVLKNDFELRLLGRKEEKIEGISLWVVNYENDEELKRFFQDATIFIHAAAITNPQDPEIRKINVEWTQRLISIAKKIKSIQKFIYISSENVTYQCNDEYTKSKCDAEEIIKSANTNFLILRPSILFGKGDDRYIAQYTKLILKFPIIPIFAKRDCTIQPIHITDVAELIKSGINHDIKGTFTIVGCSPLSFQELGKIIATLLNKKRIFIPIRSYFINFGLFFMQFFLPRLKSMIKNALLLRDTSINEIETIFSYKIPAIELRLENSI